MPDRNGATLRPGETAVWRPVESVVPIPVTVVRETGDSRYLVAFDPAVLEQAAQTLEVSGSVPVGVVAGLDQLDATEKELLAKGLSLRAPFAVDGDALELWDGLNL